MAPHLVARCKPTLMKTIRNRYHGRGHSRRGFDAETRDEFSDSDMEDSRRNEDYYFRHDRGSGYTNRDYSGGNYWPSNDALRRQRDVYEGSYVPSFDYGPHRDHPRHRLTSGSSHSVASLATERG